MQTATGTNVGSVVAGTGSTINLPSGTLSATSSFKVLATATTGGCATTSSITKVFISQVDFAIGTQIGDNHFKFDTLGTAALPNGFTAPGNSGVSWTLNTTTPAASGSYSYINGSGGISSASTGAYIQTPTWASNATPTVDLISRTINAANYTNISVQWGAQKSTGYTGSVSLYYSIDNGTTWNAVSYTEVQNNVTGNPWNQVNNNVQIKLPAAANNAPDLKLKWSANPSTDASYYSINDIGVYGLQKTLNCGGNSISLPYLHVSCNATNYGIAPSSTNGMPGFVSIPSTTNISGSPITISIPHSISAGSYNLDLTVNDGPGHNSSTISFPITTEPTITATTTLDNCACNNIAGVAGNVITVFASGGNGSFNFTSNGIGDSLRSTIDIAGVSSPGYLNQHGVKGIFWSKADGGVRSFTISDGYCSKTITRQTQGNRPLDVIFSSATNNPPSLPGAGGGNGISGSFNNAGDEDPNITHINGKALTCHQSADFGNTWVTYVANNVDSLGNPVGADSLNNKAVVEINNYGTDLDSVTVSVYRDSIPDAITNSAAHSSACAGYKSYTLERHFVIRSTKSTGVNAFANHPIGVRLYFSDAEFQDLKYITNQAAQNATGPSAGCALNDLVNNTTDLYVTKFTSSAPDANDEDGDYTNNQSTGLYRVFGPNSINGGPVTIDGGQSTVATGTGTKLHYIELNVTEFSEFWISGSIHIEALPVQMVFIEAEAMNNDSIQVRWATASEVNNREFDVERSTDGNTWTMIGVVAGHGNSNQQNNYNFNDLNVVPGIHYYYRLKQIDNNGQYQYTDIVQAMLTGQGTFMVMNFVPNPTVGNTQLSVVTTKEQEITVDFYDMLGQRVYSSVEELFAGNNKINFDLRRLAAGTYSAVVTSDNQLYTKKIVITK